MRKILYIGFISLSTALAVNSQEVRLTYKFGYGFYSALEELREFNKWIFHLNPYDIHPELIENYPPWINHSFSAEIETVKNLHLGVTGSFYSTGSKIGISDYSGSYSFESILNSYFGGLSSSYYFVNNEKRHNILNPYLSLRTGFIFTKLKISEHLSAGGYNQSEAIHNSSRGIMFTPGIGLKTRIFHWLETDVILAGRLSPKTKLHNPEDEAQTIRRVYKNVNVNWSGFQVGVGLNIVLNNGYRKTGRDGTN